MMENASPEEWQLALEAVDVFRRAGVFFVPMPVLDEGDYDHQVDKMLCRLDLIFIEKGIRPAEQEGDQANVRAQ